MRFVVTLLGFLVLARTGSAQSPRPAAGPDRSTILKVAREVMASARHCALITIGEDGRPQARSMDPFAPEEEWTVWLATNAASRKVGEVRQDPRVTLYYFDSKSAAYVTILGDAQLVNDAAERARRWKPDWSRFYADQNRGPDYLLLKVKPVRLELVSEAHGITGDPRTWRAAVVEFR